MGTEAEILAKQRAGRETPQPSLGRLCKTNPIAGGQNQHQLLDEKRVMEIPSRNRRWKTNPIVGKDRAFGANKGFYLCSGAAPAQDAVAHWRPTRPLFVRHVQAVGCKIIAGSALNPQRMDRLCAYRAIRRGFSRVLSGWDMEDYRDSLSNKSGGTGRRRCFPPETSALRHDPVGIR
jgi:hypothetical protein